MRDYEVVYIFKSALGTEAIDARLQSYHEKILESDGSEISAVEHWGKRQLAYPIDRNESGYYVVAQFSTDPEALPEYERLLKLDEEVLRHLVVLSEGELAVPSSMRDDDDEPRGGRGDDDDDDDEDDGDDDDEAEGDDDEDDGDDESDAEDDDDDDEDDGDDESDAEDDDEEADED
jgi:ribosomal protein S6